MMLKNYYCDSVSGDTLIYLNGEIMPIEEAFIELKYDNDDIVLNLGASLEGNEIVPVNYQTTYTYVNGKLSERYIRYIMRHKVSKAKYKITTESGKTVEVTEDHSCMVLRNGELIAVKATEINIDTDKIISIEQNE